MTSDEFSVQCQNCGQGVNGWIQIINYTLTPSTAAQGAQTIKLSCGCTVDFPDWKVNLSTGECKILDPMGNLFIEFLDEEMILEEEDD